MKNHSYLLLKYIVFCIFFISWLVFSSSQPIKHQREASKFEKFSIVVVNAKAPVISVHPINATVLIPIEWTFTVEAFSLDGGDLTYQWYSVSDSEKEAGIAIDNARNANYTVRASKVGKIGYYCVITNTISDNGDGGIKSVSVTSATAWFEAKELLKPIIKVQPKKLNVVTKNQNATLECRAEIPNHSFPIAYQWYKSSDEKLNFVEPIIDADKSVFTTPKFSEKGIKYFFCVATPQILTNDHEILYSVATVSDIVSVAYTGLPIIKINTPDNIAITSKSNWIENATLSIEGVENGDWNIEEIKTNIRGRGNTTWSKKKKPYAIKLDKKKNILGMPKHKQWNLIANYLDNSFMRNEIAFYLSEQFGLEWTVHGKFVDLILNGEYIGLYWIGETIKVDENRININNGSKTMTDDEDKGYIIEMDSHYDERVQFKSSIRKIPYMIKNNNYMINDDNVLSTGGKARLDRLKGQITKLETLLYPNATYFKDLNNCAEPDESYSTILDTDSWAKFWLVNEILGNRELRNPKSCFFTFDNNILKAGPVWDFDRASNKKSNTCILKDTIYYNALFKSLIFRTKLKKIWDEKSNFIDVSLKIEQLRDILSVAAEYDAKLWEVNHNPANLSFENFNGHVDFLKSVLINKLKVVSKEIATFSTNISE